jgi:polyphenol oxidase
MNGATSVRSTLTERPTDWAIADLERGICPDQRSSEFPVESQRLTWLRQVHGNRTIVVDSPGASQGVSADAAVTNVVGAQLLVRTADCAPVTLVGVDVTGRTVLGVAHAGWGGIRDGVCESVVRTMRSLGATDIVATAGACIGPECYEFGSDDLLEMVRRFGEVVRSRTATGRPSLNVTECLRSAFAAMNVDFALSAEWSCTACSPARYYSHRARHDVGRMGLVAEIFVPQEARR